MDKIYKEVAKEVGIPYEVVRIVHRLQWKFIKEQIEKLPLKEVVDEEQFNGLRTNFYLQYIGKLYTTYKYLQIEKKIHNRIINRNNDKKDEDRDEQE